MSTDTSPPPRRTADDWRRILSDIASRGISTRTAAAELGVTHQTIQYWRRKLAADVSSLEGSVTFREIPFAPSPRFECEIVCGEGTRVVCRGVSAGDVASLVRALEGGSSC